MKNIRFQSCLHHRHSHDAKLARFAIFQLLIKPIRIVYIEAVVNSLTALFSLIEEFDMRALGIFLISLFLITATYANPCPSSKIAAWYVSSAEDINILEKKKF